ncbi:MAG: DUF192 domain-containing protein [Gammaproteobacteria bacterium]|nr:DUF192 domain-containing protein [Gammaproteobacteria bacterium]
MRKNSLAKLSFILLLFLTSFNCFSSQQFFTEIMELNNKQYKLEIADTDRRKRRGLMYRQRLDQDAGMLFIYANLGDYRIWMKNTLIPLTVIWLDEQARIVDKKILQPCEIDNCPVFAASAASQFILELHPAEFSRFNIGEQLPAILMRGQLN